VAERGATAARGFTLTDLIARNARRYGERVAFLAPYAVTHRQHRRRVDQLAGLQRSGIVRGDCVAILSKNRIEYLELIGAAARVGAIVSALNWRLSAPELATLLDNDVPKIVFVEDEFWPLMQPWPAARPSSELVCIGAVPGRQRYLDDLYFDAELSDADPADADAPLLLIHTASTDGRSKAAMLSNRNLIANAMQLQAAWGLTAADVHLCCLPLFHITALSLVFATQFAGGSSIVMPKYDAAEAARLVERHEATLLAEFAPMLQGLLDAVAHQPARLASIRHVCGLDTPQTIGRLEVACPGATFWAGYGQTEASGLVSLGAARDSAGSVGFPLPLCAIDVVGHDGGPLPVGDTGEIVVRGPTVFAGYRNRPDESALAFRGGWLHTGDGGRLDHDGRLWFGGRLAVKELIKTGGENVYPAEVESVLRQHPAVLDVAVVGVPDATWGEAVKAVCVIAPGAHLSEDELIEFVASRIARYKRPRVVLFVPALPRHADGSVDRERIRQFAG
jgi:long-chain acyl-CoA synthetase